ncbi:DinB family protein [Bacillus salipaludis]|uniref:DinB family protein n=1 Tax=Bacillus salipaludis TaxID=2547811 RepID=A0A4R5VKU1_9BACI|nr:DinB family protein [Bacillus salipaludis]MDQ6595655.1 DinB family protein [Bacillus salipaludis]TDK58603.1 DinB family protein [Bacillus salipaludis]
MSSVSENLAVTRNGLVDEIKSLTYEEFNHKHVKEKWSVAEVCHHLVLLERRTAKLIHHLVTKPEINKAESKPIQHATDRSTKYIAPEIVQPSGEPFEVQQMLEMLNDARNKLLKVLDSLEDQSILAERSAAHPVFGELPLTQWVELIYLHELRHIEQIKEIKQLVNRH